MSPRRHLPRLALLACAALLLPACTGDDAGPAAVAVPAEGGSWTLLQFSMADNDLEPFMMADLDELAEVEQGDRLAVTAFVDRAADHSDAGVVGLDDWVGAKVLDITGGEGREVDDLGDVDTGDPAVLQAFLADGIARHPADHYALVLSDHGASWPGVGGDESTDDGDALELAELRSAIAGGLEAAGVAKLDLLGFDACLMAGYEVASAMAPLADRMVASQELEPGHGWDYGAFGVLARGGSADDLGNAVIDGFARQARDEGTDDEITLSLVDLTRVPALDEAVAGLSGALTQSLDTVAPAVGRRRASTLGFGRSPDPTEDTQMTDLGQLASGIAAAAPSVAAPAQAVVTALDAAVVRSLDSAGTKGATGLSIYFPPTREVADGGYQQVASAKPWAAFLSSFYDAGDALPQAEQATLTAQGGENLVGATISYGLVAGDGTVTYVGEEPAEIDEDGSATGTYDLTQLVMSDGEDEATAYLSLTYEEGDEVSTIDVPMAYYADGDQDDETYQDVLLTLTLDPDTGDVLSETYYAYDEETDTYGELTADPEGIIVPEVLRLTPDGEQEWVPTSDVGLYAELEDITYDLQPLEPGTALQLDLSVEDFGGNVDTISAQVDVP